MTRIIRFIFILFSVGLLTACGSSITRHSDSPALNLSGQQFKRVDIKATAEMREKFSGNSVFKEAALRETIMSKLLARKLVSEAGEANSGQYLLEVTVIDGRVRSNFSAVMWGVFAGADSLEGEVNVKKITGESLGRFQVNANYAFGGTAGGNEQVRMGWLYDAFAKQVVAGLSADDKEKISLKE